MGKRREKIQEETPTKEGTDTHRSFRQCSSSSRSKSSSRCASTSAGFFDLCACQLESTNFGRRKGIKEGKEEEEDR